MNDKIERQRRSAEALAQKRADELEHANQLRSEWNDLDTEIYMLTAKPDAELSDFERRVSSILRKLFDRMEMHHL